MAEKDTRELIAPFTTASAPKGKGKGKKGKGKGVYGLDQVEEWHDEWNDDDDDGEAWIMHVRADGAGR